jgi:hypothetical protein
VAQAAAPANKAGVSVDASAFAKWKHNKPASAMTMAMTAGHRMKSMCRNS